ncbi:MAG: hypothetical protein CL840_19660 [Crocinitomicaceae bacterium]|nr:hypothetical protein [Crocinitomicaceae bacterium]|tara:strand:- start:6307 stop:6834 length:528 start_codon:yes stop_codon:yes gene_type:complete
MEIKTGTKVDHERYGEGVITSSSVSGFTVIFKRAGEMTFSRLTDDFEVLEEGDGEAPQADGKSVTEVASLLKNILEEFNGLQEVVDLGDKWEGGIMVLNPGNPDLQSKEIPIQQFFHKIVMVRDRLRVLEQNINSHSKLTDEEKVHLQQYITRSYGSLTTFNVLFKNKEDQFSSK